MGFVDLHSHVLPLLDDGAKTLAESMEMLSLLGRAGFTTVCATPHQRAGMFLPAREAIDDAYAWVRGAIPAGGPELLLAAENMWDEVFLERSLSSLVPTYTGARAFLFELPVHVLPPRIEERLFAIRRGKGAPLPVMAHPERYPGLTDDKEGRERLSRMRGQAALVVDLGALDGAHGARSCKAARFLVEENLAHAAASDCHQPGDIKSALAGIAWIRKRLGEPAVRRLLDDGPRQILIGELPD